MLYIPDNSFQSCWDVMFQIYHDKSTLHISESKKWLRMDRGDIPKHIQIVYQIHKSKVSIKQLFEYRSQISQTGKAMCKTN